MIFNVASVITGVSRVQYTGADRADFLPTHKAGITAGGAPLVLERKYIVTINVAHQCNRGSSRVGRVSGLRSGHDSDSDRSLYCEAGETVNQMLI